MLVGTSDLLLNTLVVVSLSMLAHLDLDGMIA